eukprot:3007568-Pyramimonas_sp.AAC.1
MAKQIVELRPQLEKLGRTSGSQPAAPSVPPWTSGAQGEAASKRAREPAFRSSITLRASSTPPTLRRTP